MRKSWEESSSIIMQPRLVPWFFLRVDELSRRQQWRWMSFSDMLAKNIIKSRFEDSEFSINFLKHTTSRWWSSDDDVYSQTHSFSWSQWLFSLLLRKYFLNSRLVRFCVFSLSINLKILSRFFFVSRKYMFWRLHFVFVWRNRPSVHVRTRSLGHVVTQKSNPVSNSDVNVAVCSGM